MKETMINILRKAILANSLGHDFDRSQMNMALSDLRSCSEGDASAILRLLASDTDPLYRAYSVDIASIIQSAVTEQLVDQLLDDECWYVKINASHAARSMNLISCAERLARMLLSEPDELVRNAIANDIRKIGNPVILSILTQAADAEKAVNSDGVPIRDVILRSIEHIRKSSTVL